MACSTSDRSFGISKNYQTFMSFYIGRSVQHDCHSGTGTAVVELYVNDTLNVRTENNGVQVFEMYSSFSAVKLK